jgi:hypothetical protein
LWSAASANPAMTIGMVQSIAEIYFRNITEAFFVINLKYNVQKCEI